MSTRPAQTEPPDLPRRRRWLLAAVLLAFLIGGVIILDRTTSLFTRDPVTALLNEAREEEPGWLFAKAYQWLGLARPPRRNDYEIVGDLADLGTNAAPPLIAALKDPSARVREAAAGALGRIGDPRAMVPLTEALSDEAREVRMSAARALGRLEQPAATAALAAAVADSDWVVRQEAVDSLGRLGSPQAVPSLITALDDKERLVRRDAADALAKIDDPRVVPALVAVVRRCREIPLRAADALERLNVPEKAGALRPLLADPDMLVRGIAVRLLGKAADPADLPAILAALKDEAPYVRAGAAGALCHFDDQPAVLPALLAAMGDAAVRADAAKSLGCLGGPETQAPLRSALQDPSPDVRAAAADALGNLVDHESVPQIVAMLKDQDPQVRTAAAGALGSIGGPQAVAGLCEVPDDAASDLICLGDTAAVPALLATLADPDSSQGRAAWVLGYLDDRRAVGPLLTLLKQELKNESDRECKDKAVEALGWLGDPAAVPALLAEMEGDRGCPTIAAAALGRLGDSRAAAALAALLRNTEAEQGSRVAAAEGLGLLGGPTAMPLLADALKDSSRHVRAAAAEALAVLGDPAAAAALEAAMTDRSVSVRQAAMRALANLGASRSLPVLLAAARDRDGRIREAAVEAMGILGDPQAVDALSAALKDVKKGVRSAASQALGRIRGPRATAALVEALRSPDTDVRAYAAAGLGACGDPAVAPHLRPLLADRDDRVRREAAVALGMLGQPDVVPVLARQVLLEGAGVRLMDIVMALSRIDTPEARAALEIAAVRARHPRMRPFARRVLDEGGAAALAAVLRQSLNRDLGLARCATRYTCYLNDSRVQQILTEGLKSREASVRISARAALRRMERRP